MPVGLRVFGPLVAVILATDVLAVAVGIQESGEARLDTLMALLRLGAIAAAAAGIPIVWRRLWLRIGSALIL
jgi:hypothetical protein